MIKRKLSDIYALGFSVICIIFLFMYPAHCIDAAKDGLNTALYIVLPSIFPFMVLSKYIINNNLHIKLSKIIGVPFSLIFKTDKKYAALFILGCIGGYPIGAISINQMLKKGDISIADAEFLIGFCNNSSPMFVIGTIGTLMLNNTFFGYVLYLIHLFSVIVCGLIICRFTKRSNKSEHTTIHRHQSTTSPVSSSANSMLNIASYIVIFSVVSKVITLLLKKDSIVTVFILCILELTTGIKYASLSFLSEALKLSIISASLGFSGLCVFFQSKSVFDEQKISFRKYLITKTFIALISFAVSYAIFSIILP